ncbi:hypothetical protein [Paraburkholderia sp. BR10882]|uniref:hypothetical protein n=1 Tax=unclassified Paraburkholderia TaxID=2615204 RepID=UPI0034CF30CF
MVGVISGRSDIEAYLTQIGQNSPLDLDESRREITDEDSKFLLQRFDKTQRLADVALIAAIATLLIIFFIFTALIFIYRNNLAYFSTLTGGDLLSMLTIVSWLRRLWLEKTTIETLRVFLVKMKPEDAAQIITTFYFNAMKQSPNIQKAGRKVKQALS